MAKPSPILRTCTVSTKVHNVNLSEWVREALLDRLKPRDAPSNETVLAELMALRTIVINLAIAQARGQPMSQGKIQELIDYARPGAIPPRGGANRRSGSAAQIPSASDFKQRNGEALTGEQMQKCRSSLSRRTPTS